MAVVRFTPAPLNFFSLKFLPLFCLHSYLSQPPTECTAGSSHLWVCNSSRHLLLINPLWPSHPLLYANPCWPRILTIFQPHRGSNPFFLQRVHSPSASVCIFNSLFPKVNSTGNDYYCNHSVTRTFDSFASLSLSYNSNLVTSHRPLTLPLHGLSEVPWTECPFPGHL